MNKNVILFLFLFWVFFESSNLVSICADENDDQSSTKAYNDLLNLFDFEEIQNQIDADLSGDRTINFKTLVEELITKGIQADSRNLLKQAKYIMFSELQKNMKAIRYVIIISIFTAVLSNLIQVFGKSSISEMSFCIAYMCLLVFLFQAFLINYQMIKSLMEQLSQFMRAMLPAYIICFHCAGSETSAIVYYEILLAVIRIVEVLLQKVFLPLVLIFFMLRLLNNLTGKSMLTRMSELIKTLIDWGIKTILAGMIGFQILQSLLLPYIDKVKGSVLQKIIEALPGVGQTWSTYSQIILSSGTLIKNAIGVASVLVIGTICLIPFIKTGTVTIIYLLTAACVEPYSDERYVKGIDSICEALKLLIKILISGCLLFVITITLICASGSALVR